MFEVHVFFSNGTDIILERVEEVIPPQGTFHQWSVIQLPNDEGIRESIFYRENTIDALKCIGKDEEDEANNVVRPSFEVLRGGEMDFPDPIST